MNFLLLFTRDMNLIHVGFRYNFFKCGMVRIVATTKPLNFISHWKVVLVFIRKGKQLNKRNVIAFANAPRDTIILTT